MNVSQYRDEIDGLADSISSFTAAADYGERSLASGRLYRWWDRVSKTERPKRLPEADKRRGDGLLRSAAALLNDWHVESLAVSAGTPEIEKAAPPAQAMIDTMRFCAAAKRHGLT